MIILVPIIGTLIIAVISFVFSRYADKQNKQYNPYDELVKYFVKNETKENI